MRIGKAEFWWGVLLGSAATAATTALVVRPAAVSAAPAASSAYTSKVVLENARVRVKDVTIPPRAPQTGMHTHDLAHVGVILTAGALVFTEPGKPDEKVSFDAGGVGFRDAGVTHRVTNPGEAPMRVIEVELK
jgi:quercetin dioxygenase-like cupin family protein